MPRIGIVVALTDELRALNRLLKDPRAVLMRTGMGPVNARYWTTRLINDISPSFVLIAGFGAALAKEIRPGDLVIADCVALDASRNVTEAERFLWPPPLRAEIQAGNLSASPIPEVQRPSPYLLGVARTIAVSGLRTSVGGLVTTPVCLQYVLDKRALQKAFPDALALDMESAGAAAACDQAGVPWIAVRAITDGVDDDLPFPFESYLNESIGEVSRSRIARAAILRPAKIPALMRLGRRSVLAARNLAAVVEALVTRFPPTPG